MRGGFVLRLSRAARGGRRAQPARCLCLGTAVVAVEGRGDPGHPSRLAQVGHPGRCGDRTPVRGG